MPPIITSAHNPTVKQLKKLVTSAKTRKETNTYIAEGTHLTHSYLASGQTPSCFVVAESAMKNPEVAELTTTLLSRDIQCDMLSDTLFESFSSIHASVGIILLFHTTQPEIADITLTSSCIVLEDVQDPGNLGTILRTATAAGIKSAIRHSAHQPGLQKHYEPAWGRSLALLSMKMSMFYSLLPIRHYRHSSLRYHHAVRHSMKLT
jgi:TrmH family RNA methyltransferase